MGKKKRKTSIKDKPKVELRSRYRFNWKYWELPTCNTPVFMADAQAYNGDHYKQMKEFCNDILDDIEQTDLCPKTKILGGACVVLYEKRNLIIEEKVNYILTTDKRGYKIAYRVDAKGKRHRIKYKLAEKRLIKLKSERKRTIKKRKKQSFKVVKMHELGDGCVKGIEKGI